MCHFTVGLCSANSIIKCICLVQTMANGSCAVLSNTLWQPCDTPGSVVGLGNLVNEQMESMHQLASKGDKEGEKEAQGVW